MRASGDSGDSRDNRGQIVGIVEDQRTLSRRSNRRPSVSAPRRAAAVVLSPTEFDVDDDELLPDQAILDGIKAAKMK